MGNYQILLNKKRTLAIGALTFFAVSTLARAEQAAELDFESESEFVAESSAEVEIEAELEELSEAPEQNCVEHTFSTKPADCDNQGFFWGTRAVRSCDDLAREDSGLAGILQYYNQRGISVAQQPARCNGGSSYVFSVAYDTCTVQVCETGAPQPTVQSDPTPSQPTLIKSRIVQPHFKSRKRCVLRKRFSCRGNRIRYYPRANGTCCLYGRKR